jgi:hypothetical protein
MECARYCCKTFKHICLSRHIFIPNQIPRTDMKGISFLREYVETPEYLFFDYSTLVIY